MSFCSFTKDYSKSTNTSVSNAFITEYLPEAGSDAVKVYVYGLYLCQNSFEEVDVDAFAKSLYMTVDDVRDYFRFWEDSGVVSVISEEPFTVKYLSLSAYGKPRKFKAEKYTEFNKAVQTLITDRMISTAEYSEYFSIMEDYSIKPEAMLMIVKYCVDLKGANIGHKYISTVCRNFAERQLTTVDSIENELSEYITRSGEIGQILAALGSKRKPDVEDLNYYVKWHGDMQFELSTILFAAKKGKIKNMEKLDAFLVELWSGKCFGEKEIESYIAAKNELKETAVRVAKALSVYCEVITPYVDNYVSPWTAKGYDSDTLVKIAGYCFKTKRKSFEDMNDFIEYLYSRGLVTLESIALYIASVSADDEFIKRVLDAAASQRRPNKWDRENLHNWREWGFSDEMLIEAAKLSRGKNNPISYINIILSNWKAQGIFTADKIPSASGRTAEFKAPLFGNERNYTKEDFENVFDNLEDIDF